MSTNSTWDELKSLTRTEAFILFWKCQGSTYKEIGEEMGYSEVSITWHMSHVYSKFGFDSDMHSTERMRVLKEKYCSLMLVMADNPDSILDEWPPDIDEAVDPDPETLELVVYDDRRELVPIDNNEDWVEDGGIIIIPNGDEPPPKNWWRIIALVLVIVVILLFGYFNLFPQTPLTPTPEVIIETIIITQPPDAVAVVPFTDTPIAEVVVLPSETPIIIITPSNTPDPQFLLCVVVVDRDLRAEIVNYLQPFFERAVIVDFESYSETFFDTKCNVVFGEIGMREGYDGPEATILFLRDNPKAVVIGYGWTGSAKKMKEAGAVATIQYGTSHLKIYEYIKEYYVDKLP